MNIAAHGIENHVHAAQLLGEIRGIDAVAHLVVNVAGDGNAAVLGQPLQAGRNVDPLAVDVLAIIDDVTQVDDDAKSRRLAPKHFCIAMAQLTAS